MDNGKAAVIGSIIGVLAFSCIGGIGIAAGGDAFGIGCFGFLLIGVLVAVGVNAIYKAGEQKGASGWPSDNGRSNVREAAYKAALNDIEKFILTLRAQSDEEIACTLQLATQVRLSLHRNGHISQDVFDMRTSSQEHGDAQMMLNRMINAIQAKNDYELALGNMVWLHSIRSQYYPELRIKGQEMWRELKRGLHVIEPVIEELNRLNGTNIPQDIAEHARYVPSGLER